MVEEDARSIDPWAFNFEVVAESIEHLSLDAGDAHEVIEWRFGFPAISFSSVRKKVLKETEHLGRGGFGLAVHSPDDGSLTGGIRYFLSGR